MKSFFLGDFIYKGMSVNDVKIFYGDNVTISIEYNGDNITVVEYTFIQITLIKIESHEYYY